jgi:uncharacterized membrane protein
MKRYLKQQYLKRYLATIGLVAIATGILTNVAFSPARSFVGLKFCNRSHRGKVRVAIAYPTERDHPVALKEHRWITQGWLNLEQGECSSLMEGHLKNRYYYYFATTEGDYGWRGDQQFCIAHRPFTFNNADKQCEGGESHWEGFRELDTGKDAVDFTLTLE